MNTNAKESSNIILRERLIFSIRTRMQVSGATIDRVVSFSDENAVRPISYQQLDDVVNGCNPSTIAVNNDDLANIALSVDGYFNQWRKQRIDELTEYIHFLESFEI